MRGRTRIAILWGRESRKEWYPSHQFFFSLWKNFEKNWRNFDDTSVLPTLPSQNGNSGPTPHFITLTDLLEFNENQAFLKNNLPLFSIVLWPTILSMCSVLHILIQCFKLNWIWFNLVSFFIFLLYGPAGTYV